MIAFTGGCNLRSTAVPNQTPTAESATGVTPTIPPPTATPTPEPLALRVNGEGVLLAEYEAQLIQIQAADDELGVTHTPEEQRQMAIDELVEQTLLAQAAVKSGFVLSSEELDARLNKLVSDAGGQEVFNAWMSANGYDAGGFHTALERSIYAARQRDAILGDVPSTAEQVNARQILVRTRETAEQILGRLQSGGDFLTLAFQYDPLTGGELGWFPRGFLTQPDVEQAAFSMQPGELSGIIETDFGFHILQVVEREVNHPLSPEARLILQQKALDSWLEGQRSAASIEILLH